MTWRWTAIVTAAIASSAHAQPLDISPVIDPVLPGRMSRNDWPMVTAMGEGFAIAGVGGFDGALQPTPVVMPSPFLASCLPTAIGTTTCLVATRSSFGAVVQRMSLADGTLDGTAHGVLTTPLGVPVAAASGDDYLIVLASGDLHLWRAGSPDTVLIPTTFPVRNVNAIACTPGRCSALIAYGTSMGATTLYRVDVGASPALGASVMVGNGQTSLTALDDQWMLQINSFPPQYAFFDDALTPLGTLTAPGVAFVCFHDGCLGVDGLGTLSRCRSGSCAPFGTLPTSLLNQRTVVTCGTASCGVVSGSVVDARVHIGGISWRDGTSVDFTDAYWSRASDQLDPRIAVTSSGPLIAYTDLRDDHPRAAIVSVAPGQQAAPIFADLGVAAGMPSRATAFVPTAMGATLLRGDTPSGIATSWLRVSPSGMPIDLRRDAFTCDGIVEAGPNGIEMVCAGLTTPVASATLLHLSDDGRPIGPSHSIHLTTPMGLALGETQSLVIDTNDDAMLVDEPGAATNLVHLAAGLRGSALAVAAGGGRFLVLSTSGASASLAVLVDEHGLVQPVSEPPAPNADAATVVFDGATFVVVWRERSPDGQLSLVARRVRVDGMVEPGAHMIASLGVPLPSGGSADVASDGRGLTAVAFTREDPDPSGAYVVSSLHAVTLRSLSPNGVTCVDASTCGSGVCSSGVCCAMACDGACHACSATGVCVSTCVDAGPRGVGDADLRYGSPLGDAAYDVAPGGRRSCSCTAARPSASPLALLALAGLMVIRGRRSSRRR